MAERRGARPGPRRPSDIGAVTGSCFPHPMEARSWTQPHPPTLEAPDPFLHLRLELTDAWRTDAGEWRVIATEPAIGLWSILGYLRWHAPATQESDPVGAPFTDVDAYLASRPLVKAIDAELAQRGEIEAGEALERLRAIGLAPWELPVRRARRRASTRRGDERDSLARSGRGSSSTSFGPLDSAGGRNRRRDPGSPAIPRLGRGCMRPTGRITGGWAEPPRRTSR